jgi:hypothetical protein
MTRGAPYGTVRYRTLWYGSVPVEGEGGWGGIIANKERKRESGREGDTEIKRETHRERGIYI